MSWNVLDIVQIESARSHAEHLYECMKHEYVFNNFKSCPNVDFTASIDNFSAVKDMSNGGKQWVINIGVYLAYAMKYDEEQPSLSQLASKRIELSFDELEHDWEVAGSYVSEVKRHVLKLVERHFSRSKSL